MGKREERAQRALAKRQAYATEILNAVQSRLTELKDKADPEIDEKAFKAGEARWNSLIKSNRQESSLITECLKCLTGEAERVFKGRTPQLDKQPELAPKKQNFNRG